MFGASLTRQEMSASAGKFRARRSPISETSNSGRSVVKEFAQSSMKQLLLKRSTSNLRNDEEFVFLAILNRQSSWKVWLFEKYLSWNLRNFVLLIVSIIVSASKKIKPVEYGYLFDFYYCHYYLSEIKNYCVHKHNVSIYEIWFKTIIQFSMLQFTCCSFLHGDQL